MSAPLRPATTGSIAALLLLATAALAACCVQIRTDISTFIVAGNDTEQLLLARQMQSGTLSRRYLLSIGGPNTSAPERARVTTRFLADLGALDEVSAVWAADDRSALAETVATLYPSHAGRLYSLTPERDAVTLFEPDHLARRARLLRQGLLSPQGRLIKRIALQDPLLLTLDAFRKAMPEQHPANARPGDYRTIILEARDSGLEVERHAALQHTMQTLFEKARDDSATITLEMTGIPVFAVATQSLIAGDVQRVTVLAALALSVLYLWLFRSWRSLLWVSTILAISLCSALLVTQWVFGHVHGLTIAIGATLIGVCIDYPIHAMVHASATPTADKRPTINRLWPSLLLGASTTVIGYAALGLSGYPGFQQISIYAGSGILVSLLLTRTLLPGLLYGWHTVRSGTATSLWLNRCDRFRRGLRTALAVGIIGALLVSGRAHWIDDLQQMTPELEPLKQQDQRVRSRMGISIEPGRFLLIEGPDLESALQRGERLYPVLEQLKQEGALTHYYGLYPWLVSDQLQRRNHAALVNQLNPGNQSLWREALTAAGLSTSKLASPNYADSSPLAPDTVLNSNARRLLSGQIASTPERTMLLVWLSTHKPQALIEAVRDHPGVRYFSQRDMLNRLAADYRQRGIILLGLGVLTIMLLLGARYRRPASALAVLTPALCSGLFVLAGWSVAGIALSFLHLVALLLVIAIGVDYGIFFYENRGGSRSLTYRAMTASMLTSATAFASLGAAQTASLRTVAATVAGGVILGFLLCPIVIATPRNDSHATCGEVET